MKKMVRLFCLMLVLAFLVPTVALAAPKYAGVHPSADAAGNVTIPLLPNGKLVGVTVWDDAMGTTDPKGAVSTFQLKPGQGFNFEWVDANGKRWWNMITPTTKAGGSLSIDPWKNPETGAIECKYIFLGK